MNYDEIVDAVSSDRWQAGKRASVQRWVRAKHAEVYLYADWSFRRQGPLAVAVEAGPDHDLSLDAAGIPLRAATVRTITDDQGDPLQFMDRLQFERAFAGETENAGRPWAYTVLDEQPDPDGLRKRVYWGPRNDTARTLNISFTLRLAHLDESGAIVDGNFASGTDRALWPIDFDDLLITGAAALGLMFEADPAWRPLNDSYLRSLAIMQGDLVNEAGGGNVQFPRDPL